MAVKKKSSAKKKTLKKKVLKKKVLKKKPVKKKTVKKKPVKKKVDKSKSTSTKKKTSAPKKTTSAKKASKSPKKKTAVKKIPKAAAPKIPVKKAVVKAGPKKKAPAKKVVEPPEEIMKPVVKSPFKKNDPKILKIQERLNHDRMRLMGMLRSSKEVERTINDITFSNEIDLASSLEGREMAFQLSSRERNELRMVEEALFKIKGDTYGVCDSCSKFITLKRLEILPLTALCIECQENLEIR